LRAANASFVPIIVVFLHGRSRSDAAMNQQLRAYLDEQMNALVDDTRQVLELADGDVYRALRITLIANSFLTEENEKLKKQVSKGYMRKK
jgi:hypothetical protein